MADEFESFLPASGPGDSYDDFYASPPARALPWPLVAAIAGGIVLVALLALGLSAWRRSAANPPEPVVRRYYQALEAQDFAAIEQCLDAGGSPAGNLLPALVEFKQQAEELASDRLGLDIRVVWSFQDLTFKTLEQTGSTARVQVNGQVTVSIEGTSLGFSRGYSATHELIRRDGQWYLTP